MADPCTDHLALGRVGATLNGKWRLDAVLGAGGMATVYKATHRNGFRVAVKVLHPLLSAHDAHRERFLREGFIANKVEHRDAVAVLDEDVDEYGNVFLVMELLDGEPVSVRRRSAGGRLQATEALWIASRLLHVLEAAHAHGIIHRDIKPENLFMTSEGQLKVLDFGIARFGITHSGNTLYGVPMGTPGYAAPEQVRGEWDVVDARADLFAVGATMFNLAVGKLIHEQSSPYAQVKKSALEPAPRVRDVDPSVPVEMAKVIDRALSFRPQDRFQTAADMGQAVASAFRSLTGQPLPDRWPDQPLASIRRARLEALPRVASTLGLRDSCGTRPPASKVRFVGAVGTAMGILAIGLGSKLHQHVGPPTKADAVQTVLTGVPIGAGPSEPLEVMPAERVADPLVPAPIDSIVPTAPALAVTSPATRPPTGAAPADSAHRIRPASPIESSAEPSLARPVASALQNVRIPTVLDRAASPGAPGAAGRMDFVERRH